MPKDRERAVNPATAQLKADKAKALKKGKAAVAAQRQERLAHRNPARLQAQIDELRGATGARDQRQLKELEEELARVQKARAALGTDAATGGRGDRGAGSARGGSSVLGKRTRGGGGSGAPGRPDGGRGWARPGASEGSSSGAETDESVRRIPMPRDTPPPPPRRERRRPRSAHGKAPHKGESPQEPLPPRPQQTVYESAPALRDLKKEAVKGLVPTAVLRRRAEAGPEAPSRAPSAPDGGGPTDEAPQAPERHAVHVDEESARLNEEERRWRMEMEDLADGTGEGIGKATQPQHAQMEEVEDEDA